MRAAAASVLPAGDDEIRRDYVEFVAASLGSILADPGDGVTIEDVYNVSPARRDRPLRMLAEEIAAAPINRWRPAVHVAGPRTGRHPLFFAHSADGEVGWFLKHMREIELGRPAYALPAPGWYGEVMAASTTGMAERLLETVREVQPSGPYALVGYCAGVGVVLEMARMLEAAGEELEHLFVVDPGLPARRFSLRDTVMFRLNQVRKQRHPVMRPYLPVARRLTADAVLAHLERPCRVDDPVERRFYRGLVVLAVILQATTAAGTPLPLSTTGTMYLTDDMLRATNGSVAPFEAEARRILPAGVTVHRYPVRHVDVWGHRAFMTQFEHDLRAASGA